MLCFGYRYTIRLASKRWEKNRIIYAWYLWKQPRQDPIHGKGFPAWCNDLPSTAILMNWTTISLWEGKYRFCLSARRLSQRKSERFLPAKEIVLRFRMICFLGCPRRRYRQENSSGERCKRTRFTFKAIPQDKLNFIVDLKLQTQHVSWKGRRHRVKALPPGGIIYIEAVAAPLPAAGAAVSADKQLEKQYIQAGGGISALFSDPRGPWVRLVSTMTHSVTSLWDVNVRFWKWCGSVAVSPRERDFQDHSANQ